MAKRLRHHVNPLNVRDEIHFDGFLNQRPIIVDIGACKGYFAAQIIEQFPEKNFLLCELRTPLMEEIQERFSAHENVHVVAGDSGKNLKHLLLPSIQKGAAVEEIYINFPDPWPKAKHHKRRCVTPTFLASVAQWIPPETQFVFQTDFLPLFEDTLETLHASPFEKREIFHASPYGIMTQWETQKVLEGKPIYRVRFSL